MVRQYEDADNGPAAKTLYLVHPKPRVFHVIIDAAQSLCAFVIPVPEIDKPDVDKPERYFVEGFSGIQVDIGDDRKVHVHWRSGKDIKYAVDRFSEVGEFDSIDIVFLLQSRVSFPESFMVSLEVVGALVQGPFDTGNAAHAAAGIAYDKGRVDRRLLCYMDEWIDIEGCCRKAALARFFIAVDIALPSAQGAVDQSFTCYYKKDTEGGILVYLVRVAFMAMYALI
ncbi:hypothetical protein DESC_520028 [Desulfosarcina cetonica]|nr:hypothetical protein DESC_520028 [Desulfosarcina cetonica]